jgi:hypothetical protein
MKYIIDQVEHEDFVTYRAELSRFIKRPTAAEDLARSQEMQAALLEAFLVHYHPDPSTGKKLLEREDIVGVVVTQHPKWGTFCFGVVLREDERCEPFSLSKKRFRPEPRPASVTGQMARSRPPGGREAYEALRHAIEPSIQEWIRSTPLPPRCPITDRRLGSLADRSDPRRREHPSTPTVDHHAPTFQELIRSFLTSEELTMETLPIEYNPALRTWELADEELQQRWIAHHYRGELRWVSLEGNRLLNYQQQTAGD